MMKLSYSKMPVEIAAGFVFELAVVVIVVVCSNNWQNGGSVSA